MPFFGSISRCVVNLGRKPFFFSNKLNGNDACALLKINLSFFLK